MKVLMILMAGLVLTACTNNHSYHDSYRGDGYYTSDYDAYYGYGDSLGYSTDGSGVYYNNYNYYPDRWGINYSVNYYSPYRYPRIGFYYNDCYYWSFNCFNGWGSSLWLAPIWGYSSWYYNDYWWYNHWRHRNYHHTPRYGRYSARREAQRLANRTRNRHMSYKEVRPYRDRRGHVSRERSRYSGADKPWQRQTSTHRSQRRSNDSVNELNRIRRSNHSQHPRVESRNRYQAPIRSAQKPLRVRSSEQPVATQLPATNPRPVYERRGNIRTASPNPNREYRTHQRSRDVSRAHSNRQPVPTSNRQSSPPNRAQGHNRPASKAPTYKAPRSTNKPSASRSSRKSSDSSSSSNRSRSRDRSR